MAFYKEIELLPFNRSEERIALNSQKLLEESQYIERCVAFFSDLMSRYHTATLQEWSYTLLSNLVLQLNACQACLYRLGANEQELLLCASVAKGAEPDPIVPIGKTLIGEIALNKHIFFVDNLEAYGIKLKAGSLELVPKTMIIIPLIINFKVEAIIELISLFHFEPKDISFVHRLSTQVAAYYFHVRSQERIMGLLRQAREVNDSLSAKEEEIRMNLEELLTTQEQLQHATRQMDNQWQALNRSLAVVIFDIDARVVYANDLFLAVMGFQFAEIEGKHYRDYVIPDAETMQEYYWLWDQLRQGLSVSKEFKRQNKAKEVIWIYGSYNPMLDAEGKPYQVIKFVIDITAQVNQKQALETYQAQIETLLLQTQSANHEMQARAEELRMNIEELQATQEQLQRTTWEMDMQWQSLNRSLAVVMFDSEARVMYANDNFLHVLGFTYPEVEGQYYRDYVIPDEETMQEYYWLWDQLSKGIAVSKEFKRQNKAKEVIWIYGSYNPVMDNHGQLMKVIKFVIDLTEQKRQKLALIEAQGRIEAILEEYQEANHELLARDEELRMNFEELQAAQEQIQRTSWEMESQWQALNRSLAVVIFDMEARIVFANDKFQAIMGFTMAEMEGQYYKDYVIPDEETFEEYYWLWEELRNGRPVSKEFKRQNKAKEVIWIYGSYNPMLDQHGKLIRVVKFVVDLTLQKTQQLEIQAAKERVEALLSESQSTNLALTHAHVQLNDKNKALEMTQQQLLSYNNELTQMKLDLEDKVEQLHIAQSNLVQSEKMASLGQLVAGIAHEVNTPLGIAVTASSLLQGATKDFIDTLNSGRINKIDLVKYAESAADSTKLILSNLKRASDLIQSFKKVSVNTSQEEAFEFKLKELIQEIVTTLSPSFRHSFIQLEVEGDQEIVMNSYPGLLSQVLINLILNAQKHAFDQRASGTITVHFHPQNEQQVRILVKDDGNGIPESIQAKIFDPFFTTKRGQGGSGLGLHIVYNTVTQQLKGTIEMNSIPGKGTEFELILPIFV
jgi:PAS domain S-box-containing protein